MRRILFAIVAAFVATTAVVGTASARPGHPIRHERWEPEPIEHRPLRPIRPTRPVRPIHWYRPAPRPVVPIGAAIEIQWGSSWWAGTVRDAHGGMFLVHYDGWSSSWDEWVEIARIRPPFGVRYVEPALQPVYWNDAPRYR